MVQCERYWGARWFYDPRRWRTADGYVPHRTLWAYWYAMEPVMAMERLSDTRSSRLAQMRDEKAAQLAVDREQQLAFPEQ